ncbi:unnamed protein product [Adineta steineri]|uniref:Uncharacterized protein n=1 Tax=Adineta steineri TaxID=433720 RepID=A0A815DZ42_9BILA|nr:unnamed protein product [Adineta steineri]CAF4095992.1 unnamed protein product [Adineta steineri]
MLTLFVANNRNALRCEIGISYARHSGTMKLAQNKYKKMQKTIKLGYLLGLVDDDDDNSNSKNNYEEMSENDTDMDKSEHKDDDEDASAKTNQQTTQ